VTVEPDAVAVEASPDRRLVDLEGSVEHVLAADVEQEIAKIMVPVRPGGTIVVGGCDPTLLVMEEADLCIRFHRLGRTRLVNRVVITSDRRVAAWGALRANWIGDAVVEEPERCGSPFFLIE
jgi:hypothetical protein